MSLDFSGLVAGQTERAADVLRPWQQTLVQSGYLSDGSDFSGFAKPGSGYGGGDVVPTPDLTRVIGDASHRFDNAHLRTITLYPGATNGSGDHDAFLFKNASAGHADHGIAFSSILFANGHYDPVMNWAYNFNPSGTRRNNAEPAYGLQLEADYDDGTFRQMEYYLTYTNIAGTKTLRPLFVQANRNNDTITTLLAGGFLNLSGWLGHPTVVGDTLVITGKNVFVKDNTAQTGGAASEFHVEKNGYAAFLQATNPAGRFGASELRLPYIDANDRIYSDGLGLGVEHAIDNLVLSLFYTPTSSADASGSNGRIVIGADGNLYYKTNAAAYRKLVGAAF